MCQGDTDSTRQVDTESTILIAHGSGQDQSSLNELTTRVLAAARAAGRPAYDFGGPGSVESAIKLTSRGGVSSIYDHDVPLDVLGTYATGAIGGTGFREVVEEIVARIVDLGKEGCPKVHAVGFSRGAVAMLVGAQRLGELREKFPGLRIPRLTVSAFDPVPGPFGVPKKIKVPKSVVSGLKLVVSKHEGRPGFDQLQISYDGPDFWGDVAIGSHGDIGGSTQSPLARLVLSGELGRLGLPGPHRLTLEERDSLEMDCLLSSSSYTDRPKFVVRTFLGPEGAWIPSDRGDLELPTSEFRHRLWRRPLGRLLLDPFPGEINEGSAVLLQSEFFNLGPARAERYLELINRRSEESMTLIENPPPFQNGSNDIIVPPPRRVQVPPLGRPVVGFLNRTAQQSFSSTGQRTFGSTVTRFALTNVKWLKK